MPTFSPEVEPAAEFLEISNDFTDPKEIVREAISNAFDAGATEIKVSAVIDKATGEDELVILVEDNGHGMSEQDLRAFFGLGLSTRRQKDEYGRKASSAIGEKGHGTKIYFNSRRVEVVTIAGGTTIRAHMDDPRKTLRAGSLPTVSYEVSSDSDSHSRTLITIRGYNANQQAGFGHNELKDYIQWFTKFGSIEVVLKKATFMNVVLQLRGLGWSAAKPEPLRFGHPFPEVNTDIRHLRAKDQVSPLEWYVARWVFTSEEVIGMPEARLDFVFSIEGDQAKRMYNPMIHKKYSPWRDGEYNVEQRYGLWLCKDYFAIYRKSEWVAEKSEWTKYHAFVNCQEFRLTANRADLNNTPANVMDAVEKTVRGIFESRIMPTAEFQKYREELERQEQYRNAQQEGQDFERRRKAALAKRTATIDEVELHEPRQEGGVFSVFLRVATLRPDLFDFKIIDYDTSIGYDLLVTKDSALDLNRAALRFVEMKYELQREFNHSFKRLAAVICWDTKLTNESEVRDMTGEKRTLRVSPKSVEKEDSYTKYMLVSDTEEHNIEVFVLRDYLRERLGCEFRPRVSSV
jgi:hypothetical protein